jgi:hypothetical protein
MRRNSAPTAAASPGRSTKKFDRGFVTSGASTTSGVRLLAASVSPVSALVTPGPWCTLSTASLPDTRAYPSAMLAAPPSCAAGTNRAPAATSAFVTWKLPLPTTPKTWSTPCSRRALPAAVATSIG